VVDPQQCFFFLLIIESLLSFNIIFFLPNGVSCETSSDFRRMTVYHRRGGENPLRRYDVAKRLGLPPSTLNMIIDDDEAEPEPEPSFTEALRTFESMRAFTYAHITERDQANTVYTES
jgi:hypothetical protein